jgi:3-hydroxyisobutyrate dehydrogenase
MAGRGETVAVLGAGGTMGRPMARNLARAGCAVRAWNRSREKAAPLADAGVELAATPSEAAAGAGVLLTMLSDGDAVLSVAGDALPQLSRDAVWIQASTVGEAATERCIALARERGVAFVDAPVLGTRQPAEEGTLVVLAAAADELRARVQPLFDAVGSRTVWVGEAGAATRLKLVVNAWVLAVVEAGAETVALAEGLGLDPQLFLDAIAGGGLDLPYLRAKAAMMAAREFPPSFKLSLAAKDAALVEQAAQRHGLELPLLGTLRARLAEGAVAHGDEDLSATYRTSAPA